ncbi:MAG: transposase [Candidatus Omnitrophica bacterium]|nr:transposase [Candidatus Omnitrophota bacterium]
MSRFYANVSIINKFCEYFKNSFSKKQFAVFTALLYALINEYKRLNISSLAQALQVDYEKLQYFLADSKWSYLALNEKRLELLRGQRTTGFSKDGLLIIDDTGVLKPYAQKTEGAKYQHCPVLGEEAVCNVAVASCFSVNDRYIPLELKFYRTQDEFILGKNDPDFKSKLELAKELIEDAVNKRIPFSYCLFDTWYSASDVLSFIYERELFFICEVKSNRKVYFRNPEAKKSYFMPQDELATLIKKHFWHKVKSFRHRGDLLSVYSFTSRLKSADFPVKVFVVFNNASGEIRSIISNDLTLSEKKATLTYFERWKIERLFRELKDSLYFDHYQVRHKLKIMRYWMLVILAWTLIYWIRQNGYLYRSISSSLKGKTINECKQALLKLILFSSYQALRKNNTNIALTPLGDF